MRDLIVTAGILGTLPFILRRPHIGILVWVFLSIVNPHRSTWGFAYNFPFAYIIAIATLLGMLFSKERKAIPWGAVTVTVLIFAIWVNLSTLFAWVPTLALDKWERTMKILVMFFVGLILINSRERVQQLVWTVVISLGIYGVKGGLFTIATGGNYIFFGPPGSFIESNNSLAIALTMTLPLMRYLQIGDLGKWPRRGLAAVMILMVIAIAGSHSRGAFLAAGTMLAFLWWKSPKKIALGAALIVAVVAVVTLMPESYFSRMGTIGSYEADASAMGRINAWEFAYNVAKENPLLGGGFKVFTPEMFRLYAPDPTDFHDAHSIYFEVMGEQGFAGLLVFLLLWFLAWRTASRIIRQTAGRPDFKWAYSLASMSQVSILAYLVGGAFLGLAYWDLPFYLLTVLVALQRLVGEADKSMPHPRESIPATSVSRQDERLT